MIWEPVFSPDSKRIAAKAELNGKYLIAMDGKTGRQFFDELWEPVFSPDGEKVLIRCIEDGKYFRRVIPVSEL
jgi:hypothetical protein